MLNTMLISSSLFEFDGRKFINLKLFNNIGNDFLRKLEYNNCSNRNHTTQEDCSLGDKPLISERQPLLE